ncbi:MAG: biotin--[acetyl-CoA-carboxylase] ligase [Candidatus Dormibacteria bacterium]
MSAGTRSRELGSRLQPEVLRQELAALGTPYRVRCEARVASTQDLVLAAARAGAPEGLVITADHQTLGRGRAGRRWTDSPGTSLMFSVLWRPAGPSTRWGTLALTAGLAVAEGIEAAGGPPMVLKWPNDCLTSGRKLAGILVESGFAGGPPAAVVGVGCNVAWADVEPGLVEGATALDLEGTPIPITALAAAVLASLHRRYREWIEGGFDPMLAAWVGRCQWLGELVAVNLPGGPVEGELLGVAPNGALRLRRDGLEIEVPAGDVSPAGAPALRLAGEPGAAIGPSGLTTAEVGSRMETLAQE